MITLFATPRPFRGAFAVIQRNAIASWVALGKDVEIILMGADAGTAETAAEFDLRHVPEVECNEYGTPLVSALFETAQRVAENDILAYVNADIILMEDFLEAVQRARRPRFLMVGLSWGLAVEEPLDFSTDGWKTALRYAVGTHGKRRQGMDYFVFSRGLWPQIPAFAVGRGYWDEWLMYGARQAGCPVINATAATRVVHQNHDWSIHPDDAQWIWEGPEIRRNRELAGPYATTFSCADATRRLTRYGTFPILTRQRIRRWAETLERRRPGLRPVARVLVGVTHPRSLLRRAARP